MNASWTDFDEKSSTNAKSWGLADDRTFFNCFHVNYLHNPSQIKGLFFILHLVIRSWAAIVLLNYTPTMSHSWYSVCQKFSTAWHYNNSAQISIQYRFLIKFWPLCAHLNKINCHLNSKWLPLTGEIDNHFVTDTHSSLFTSSLQDHTGCVLSILTK